MNNYYSAQDQYNYQEFYPNTYNLWQNSRYYDTNNLSLRNYTSSEQNNSEDELETSATTVTEEKSWIVNRDELYQDPELFDNDIPQGNVSNQIIYNQSIYGRPQQTWVKASTSNDPDQGPSGYNGYKSRPTCNKVEKRLNKALKKPVTMTKAESMMQKMGWQGGALGKSGDGILEPIPPNATYDMDTVAQMDIMGMIHRHNCYLLSTQSDGEYPNRQLTIYKEAHSHIFLITPDDLKENELEDELLDIDESNPFLKSITKNIKEKFNNKSEISELDKVGIILDMLVEYFIEFQGSEDYTELRFLGLFDSDEIQSINKFLDLIRQCKDGNCNMRDDLFKSINEGSKQIDIYTDVNGTAVIHKINDERK